MLWHGSQFVNFCAIYRIVFISSKWYWEYCLGRHRLMCRLICMQQQPPEWANIKRTIYWSLRINQYGFCSSYHHCRHSFLWASWYFRGYSFFCWIAMLIMSNRCAEYPENVRRVQHVESNNNPSKIMVVSWMWLLVLSVCRAHCLRYCGLLYAVYSFLFMANTILIRILFAMHCRRVPAFRCVRGNNNCFRIGYANYKQQ